MGPTRGRLNHDDRYHFGNPASHSTVEWFLSVVRSVRRADSEVTPNRFIALLTEPNSGLTEQLCWQLTAARFIRCIRKKLAASESDRVILETIAKEVLDLAPSKRRARVACLFLAAMRDYLESRLQAVGPKALGESPIFLLGKASYEHYLSRAAKKMASRCELQFALELGIHLVHLHPAPWSWHFLRFKHQHAHEMNALRYHFYGAEVEDPDPALVFSRTKHDLKTPATGHANISPTYENMDPMLYEVPAYSAPAEIAHLLTSFSGLVGRLKSMGSAPTSSTADALEKSFQSFNWTTLGKNLRVAQWELHTRDVGKEEEEGNIFFFPSVKLSGGALLGTLPHRKYLDLCRRSYTTSSLFRPSEGGRPQERPAGTTSAQPPATADIVAGRGQRQGQIMGGYAHLKRDLLSSRRAFATLMTSLERLLPTFYPDAYREYLTFISSGLSNAGTPPAEPLHPLSFPGVRIVEDGELTFLSLLWSLRQMSATGVSVTDWVAANVDRPGPAGRKQQPRQRVVFRPDGRTTFGRDGIWRPGDGFLPASAVDFARYLGLVVRLSDGRWAISPRWRSLLDWLSRTIQSLSNGLEKGGAALSAALPTKVAPGESADLAAPQGLSRIMLNVFLDSETARTIADLQARIYDDVNGDTRSSFSEFLEHDFAPLLLMLWPLCELPKDCAAGMADKALFEMARVVLLPVEGLVRAYQPHESHLVVCPVGVDYSPVLKRDAPISLGFATVWGTLPVAVKSRLTPMVVSTSQAPREVRDWLAPFWAFFAGVSSAISVGARSRDSLRTGLRKGLEGTLRALSHEAGATAQWLFGTVFVDLDTVFSIDNAEQRPSHVGRVQARPLASTHSAMGKWRVCLAPQLLEDARQLLHVWAGTKDILGDLGLSREENRADLSVILDAIVNAARSAATIRLMGRSVCLLDYDEKGNQVFNLAGLKAATQSREHTWTRTKVTVESDKVGLSSIVFPRCGAGSDEETRTEGLLAHLCRGLLASISNALYHSDPSEPVRVSVAWEREKLTFSVQNMIQEASGSSKKTPVQTYFAVGTEAVGKYCFEAQLKGAFVFGPADAFKSRRGAGEERWFVAQAEIPTVFDGVRWVERVTDNPHPKEVS